MFRLGRGMALLVAFASLVAKAPAATTEFTGGGITIPDSGNGTPYPSAINVSGISGTVTAVRVKLTGFSHTYPADVEAYLLAPDGRYCTLLGRVGGFNPGVAGVNLVFDDAAGTLIPAGSPVTSGSYSITSHTPVGSLPPGTTGDMLTTLAAMAGGGTTGAWKLFVQDLAGGDSGSIVSWALEFDHGAITPLQALQAYVKASNTGSSDQFGFSVAISGDTAVVGAQFEDSNATGINGNESDNSVSASGAAYVFVRNGMTWTQQAYLKASNAEANDRFGYSVAVSGDTVVVGADGEDSNATGVNGNGADNSLNGTGAAYVFVRNGTTWTQQAYLKASNTGNADVFGWSVAVSGDTVVVGAYQEESNATGVNGNEADNSLSQAGAAYVFVRSGNTWSQQAYLKASNPGNGDYFGHSVAVDSDTILVGAAREGSNATGVNGDGNNNNASQSGAAYVFVRNGATWSLQAYLKASNTGSTDYFGWSVGLSGDTAVVGAYQEDSNATGINGDDSNNSAADAGAAYVFARVGTTWSQQAYLKGANTEAGDNFGYSVSVSGDFVLVGARGEDGGASGVNGIPDNTSGSSGAAYLFERAGTTWSQRAYLKAGNPGSGDSFGGSVGLSGDSVIVGAISEDSNATGINGDGSNNSASGSGAAYIYASPPPAPEIAVEQPSGTDILDGGLKDFGPVLLGANADLIFTIRNTGTLNLTGISATIDGADSALFTVTSVPSDVLNPGGSTTFTVRFAPVSTGLKSANLHIASNDADENPFDIVLTGTGAVPAPEIVVEQPVEVNLLDGGMKSFGNVAVNSTADLTFTIRNTGTANLTGITVSVDGTDSALFTVTSVPSDVLNPGGSTMFTVRFAPVSLGLKNAALRIASNDADENPFDILVDGTGTAEQMIARESNRSWRGVASSADGVKLVAVPQSQHIHTSTDSGVTWTERALPTGPKNWYAVASSADGTKLVAVADGSRIHTSIDSGMNWTEQLGTSARQWRSVASSADGAQLIAGVFGERLWTSIDSGVTWSGTENNRNWKGVASSADGSKLVAVVQNGKIYTSVNSGAEWTERMNDQNRQWYGVASSADGTRLVAVVYGGQVYTSSDSGVNWTAREGNRQWVAAASSADGSRLVAAVQDGQIHVSTDYGVNWLAVDSERNWSAVASSGDGAKLLASVYGGQLYTLGTAPEIAVEQPLGLDLATGGMKDFGPVMVGGHADLEFTIRNPGNQNLTLLVITIDGTHDEDFAVISSADSSVIPAGTTTFTVRFAPLADGVRTAVLHIVSTDADESPFDVILNGTGIAPAPEIAVEQPLATDLLAGAGRNFGAVITGTTGDLIFTIKNTGAAALTGVGVTLDGLDAGQFSVTASPATSVAAGGSTTFTVRFAPAGPTGLRNAALHIASNDADENPFTVLLSGMSLSATADFDEDGMNDAAEYHLSALGFDWQLNQTALVNTYYTHAPKAGLYTQSQLQALNVGTPLLQSLGGGQFRLTIGVRKSTDLNTFSPLPMTAPQTTINGQGELEFLFTSPDNAAFYLLRSQ
jgi:hypothetical protein